MIRSMVADGVYYSADAHALRGELARAFQAESGAPARVRAAIVPFGRYDIALPFIVAGLKRAADRTPECVVVLAPPDGALSGTCMLPESDSFATPFGALPVAGSALSGLLKQAANSDAPFALDEIAHLQNHSIEIVLPVIHYLYGDVPILPILVGALSGDTLDAAARAVRAATAGRDTLVVAAANMSGFVRAGEAEARARKLVRLLMSGSGDSLLDRIPTFENPPGSTGAIGLTHLLAGEDTRVDIVRRGTFEVEFDGRVACVVYAAIDYISW